MRLSEDILIKIKEYKQLCFPHDSSLYLFGSRTDDTKKGGDIDLFLESKSAVDPKSEIDFLKLIYKNATQRKIDLVVKTPDKKTTAIYQTAKAEGVLLC